MESSGGTQDIGEEEDLFDIKKIEIDPETSPITQEVAFTLHFSVNKPITGIQWRVKYIVDSTGTRNIIELLETSEPENYLNINTPI